MPFNDEYIQCKVSCIIKIYIAPRQGYKTEVLTIPAGHKGAKAFLCQSIMSQNGPLGAILMYHQYMKRWLIG